MKTFLIRALLLILFITPQFFSQVNFGELLGRIVDEETQQPLIGANVFIHGTSNGTITNNYGEYKFEKLPVGTYTVTFSYIGYKQLTKTDIIIKSKIANTLNIQMKSSMLELESVVVKGGYFTNIESKPVSTVNYSAEEIRRAPGSAGDVSRILFGLPSLAKVNDQMNSLIVRGGSPIENSFYLDNIEIQNINHFPVQGSSDGPISIINVDFVDDVEFYSGGFSAIYGDRLSSIMNIKFREGNSKSFLGKADLSFSGFRGTFESPIGDKGSFMISGNRSYLDLIVGAVNESGPVPQYGDIQGKVTYNFSDKHKVTLLGLWSSDYINYTFDNAIEDNGYAYGESDIKQSTIGLNWRFIWSKNGYSNTSFSYNKSNDIRNYSETSSKNKLMDSNSKEDIISIRNINYYKITQNLSSEFGVEAKIGQQNFDILFGEYIDRVGNIIPEQLVYNNLSTTKLGAFASFNWQLTQQLSIVPGLRADYFDYTKQTSLSPRLTINFNATEKLAFTAAIGKFYQNIPNYILAQSRNFSELKTPSAIHYSLGSSYLLTESTRLSIELYYKKYFDAVIDLTKPNYLVFDQAIDQGIILNHSSLTNDGKAFSRGIEIVLQKKLAEDLYGMVSASYSKNRYSDLYGTWRNRRYDNQFMFTLEGGYKLNDQWEFSGRWIFAGGAPYTPFNIEKSTEAQRGIDNVNMINGERLPSYHSLNLRVDKRFYFGGSNLIVYLSIWNVYGRKNISGYNWNLEMQQPSAQKMWGTLPVLGIEFDF